MPKLMTVRDMMRLVAPAKMYYSMDDHGRARVRAARIANAMIVWSD